MDKKVFPSGRIREASYDRRQNYLELVWDDKTVTALRPVPHEVYERLCKAPNPATYFEDRIAEEYPQVQPIKKCDSANAAQKLNDLFGG